MILSILNIFGRMVGIGAALFIGWKLKTQPGLEPRKSIRYPEIAVSLAGAGILLADTIGFILA